MQQFPIYLHREVINKNNAILLIIITRLDSADCLTNKKIIHSISDKTAAINWKMNHKNAIIEGVRKIRDPSLRGV